MATASQVGRGGGNEGRNERLSFEAFDDHIVVVARDGCRLLLDTGSPVSLGEGAFQLLGQRYDLDSRSRLDFGRLGELVGTHLDGLIGTDVLMQAPFRIHWPSQTLVFGCEAARTVGTIVPMTTILGVPKVEREVAGSAVNAFVDTGAAISFFTEPWDGLPNPVGKRHEFFLGPNGLEEFDTQLWRLPVTCGKSFEATFGQLPPELSRALTVVGIKVILGTDLWRQFQVVFDIEGGRLVVGARNR